MAYVRPENTAAQRLSGAESRWAVRPFRAVLECATVGGSAEGRGAKVATPADGAQIVEILNRCHHDEELFMLYTEATFAERLSRAPDLYTWHDVLLAVRAVVGVWRSAETRTFEREGDAAWTQRRASVLDYGYEPGGEDDLVALLRAWCGRLARDGFTHLGIFTSPASPGSALLRELAAEIEEYDIMPPGLAEPPTAATNGIYVDPVYF